MKTLESDIKQTFCLLSQPSPVVTFYTSGLEITTVNLAAEEYTPADTAEDAEPDMDGGTPRFRCTSVTLTYNGHITADMILKSLWDGGLYGLLDGCFLGAFAARYSFADYNALAAALVGGRYTYADELACHRKALNGDTEDLRTLNLFVEECKQLARQVFPKC